MIEANDPRLKTAEGWDELGAPFDATHWVGPALQPWEKIEGSDRFIWHDSEWYESYLGRITDRFESILRPVDEGAKMLVMNSVDEFQRAKHLMENNTKLELEPMTDSDCEEIVTSYNSDSDKFKAENKWHDRIDFPFAGTECEMYVVTDWHLARIIGMDEEGLCVASVHFDEHRGYRASPDIRDFRPLKTDGEIERDEDIREALEHIRQDLYAQPLFSISEYVEDAVAQLYDAGYRKPMSREEADNAINNAGVPIMNNRRSVILDALGYGEE